MKTPGQVLLEHHGRSEPALDSIRGQVLSELAPIGPLERVGLTGFWGESVGAGRLRWAVLAVAWVLIAGLNLARAPWREDLPGSSVPIVAGVRGVLVEQANLRAELLGLAQELAPASEAPGEKDTLGPRSERQRNLDWCQRALANARGVAVESGRRLSLRAAWPEGVECETGWKRGEV